MASSVALLSTVLTMLTLRYVNAQVMINNGPRDTTVCNSGIANLSCGAIGTGSVGAIPNWRVVKRNSDGSVISNTTIGGNEIVNGNADGLMWVPDTTSGTNNASDNYLAVGPVDESHNQSSYQCVYLVLGTPISRIATLTVAGPPSVILVSVMDTCSYINVTWTRTSDPECGVVSYTVRLLDGGVEIMMNTTMNTVYIFGGLDKTVNYSVEVTARNMAGDSDPETFQTGMSSQLIRIVAQRPIAPILVMPDTDIVNDQFEITISWQAAPTTRCTAAVSMFSVSVTINGSNPVIRMIPSNMLSFDLPSDLVSPNTQYNIIVSAISNAGESDPSEPVSVNTLILQGCTADSLSFGVVTVSCDSSHEIQVTATCDNCDHSLEVKVGSRSVNVTDLDGGGMYTITINVYSDGEVVLMNENVTLEVEVMNRGGSDGGGGSDSNTGPIVGGVVGGIVAVIVIIVIIVVVYIFVIRPKDDSNGDKKALRMTSPSGAGTGGRATVTPSSNIQSGPTEVYADIHKPVPHQTAATGEEYAVSSKKPKPQGPTEEYAQIDKSKKSGQQGIQYADLAALPQSTNDPSAKGPTSMYAQVA